MNLFHIGMLPDNYKNAAETVLVSNNFSKNILSAVMEKTICGDVFALSIAVRFGEQQVLLHPALHVRVVALRFCGAEYQSLENNIIGRANHWFA